MAVKKKNSNLPLLFAMGILCLLYGLGASYIETHFSRSAIIISLIGLSCVVICFFEVRKFTKKASRIFQWRKYGFIVFVVVSLLAFLLGINYLSYRYNVRWDLTKAKQHTLSESTAEVINDLHREVKIVAFYVGIPPKYLEDLLNEYERRSNGMIKAEIIDPISQISYAAQFGSVISGKERKVIVLSGSERKDIDFTNQPLSEEFVTNAILQVARDKRIAYFLTGHGEYDVSDDGDNGLSILARILNANNVGVKTVMLGREHDVPQDCDVLIVAGPRNPLTEEDEEGITAYLANGGDAFFLIENTPITTPDKQLTQEEKRKNPSLNNILNHWGIKIADDIVVDLSNHIGQEVGCPATRNYPPHQAIIKDLDYTFYVRPRSISILENRRKSIKVAPVVLTASQESSWGETDKSLRVKFDKGVDTPGPVPIAVVIWEPKEENESSDTRIAVFTDTDFLSNAFIEKYSNAQMGIHVIKWVSNLEYKFFIEQKEIKVERLDLTSKQKRAVAVILFVIPFLIGAAGLMIWLKHKD
ncbi:MAG: GldG family protein [Candidatus Omnitrophica bacterium]|nr:GldG family protein [Candidatus Omnitrophota bacterium]